MRAKKVLARKSIDRSPPSNYLPATRSHSSTAGWCATVFSPDGRWLGEVRMPDRFRPSDIGADHVLGVTTDELGVEYVVRFGLEKPEE